MVKHSHRASDVVKRAFDIVVSAVALVVLSPVLLVVALLVRSKLGSPVIFHQARPGKDAKLFEVRKFRSMRDASAQADLAARQGSDAERLTPFGRTLRSTSLDELPELWNVFVGDMSLVGPRPLLPEYLTRYSPAQARRHEVRPGITGWAQVNGRNATSWEDRFELDAWYVDHRSFGLDLKILWMTIAAVFGRAGISAEGNATMPPFDPDRTSSAAEKEPLK